MTRRISRELIKHLEWNPNQEESNIKPLQRTPVNGPTRLQSTAQSKVYIDDILKGKAFYNIDMPTALQHALDFAGENGYVATMPELITTESKADNNYNF